MLQRLFVLILGACLLAPVPLLAQQGDGSDEQLVSQARYWETRGRFDLARESWLKLLRANPENPAALSGLAYAEARSSRPAAAQVYLDRLRETAPSHPEIRRIEAAIRQGSYDQERLAVPRGLARQGRYDEAVEAYQDIFGDQIPSGRLGLEYYQTLAGTETGWEPARRGIEALVEDAEDEPLYKLALGQHLTYREESRRAGISRLAEVANDPAVGSAAKQAWRQALLWLNAREGDARYYQTYLRRYGADEELQARYNDLVVTGETGVVAADPRIGMIQRAYETLNSSDLQAAAVQFREIVETYPQDEEGLAGLGIVRLRQQRFAEARDLLERAIQRAPDKAKKWQEALATARFWERVRDAEAQRELGNVQAAEAGLRSALQIEPKGVRELSVRSTLADVLVQQNEFRAAEQLYRNILATDPEYMDAVRGLIGILAREQRVEEAIAVAERLPTDMLRDIPNLSPLKATYLREQAQAAQKAKDDASAERFLKDALLLDPNSPWIRMDLARIYQRQGRVREANTLVDGILSSNPRMPEALFIKALLLSEQQRWYEGLQLLEQIALDARTPGMADLQRRLWVRYQTERAGVLARYGRPDVARRVLREVEPNHGGQAELLGALASGWAEVGEEGRALRFMREALSATAIQTAGLRLQYAALLFKLRQDAEFEVVMEDLVRRSDFTEQESLDLANLRIAYRLRQADLVREDGDLARAYEYLKPLLQVNPNDPRLMMALARLYNDAKEFDRTLEIYRRVLEQDPNNLDAYKGAIGASLALDQTEEAAVLLDEAFAMDASNPRLYALAGRLARARGEDGRALEYYQQALELDAVRGDEEFGAGGRFAPQLELLNPQDFSMRDSIGPLPGGRMGYSSEYSTSPGPLPMDSVYPSYEYGDGYTAPTQAAPSYTAPTYSSEPYSYPADTYQQAPAYPSTGSMVRPPARSYEPVMQSPESFETYPEGGAEADYRYVYPDEVDQSAYPQSQDRGSSARHYDAYPAAHRSLPSAGGSARAISAVSSAAITPARGSATEWARQLALSGPRAAETGGLVKVSTRSPEQAPRQAAPAQTPARRWFDAELQTELGGEPPLEQQLYPPPTPPARAASPARPYRDSAGPGPAFVYPEQQQAIRRLAIPPQAPISVPYGPAGNQAPVQPRQVQPVVVPRHFETELGTVQRDSRFRRDVRQQIYEISPPRQAPVTRVMRRDDPVRSVPEFARQREPSSAERRDLMREIREIRARRSAYGGLGIAFRNRDGQEGLSRLLDIELPAEFSFPGTVGGRFKLRATPVFLNAGTVSGSELPFFGTLALVNDPTLSFGQDASGVALGLIYELGDLQLDASTSPLGFPVEGAVGGLIWTPRTENFRYRFDFSRRHVIDSLLSYAGTFEPGLGRNWGGVYKTGGRLDVAYDLGDYGAYVNGSYHVLDGTNVDTNNVLEVGGGFYARGAQRSDFSVTYGVNATSFFYEKNRRRFTYGHGGYFSPQFYLSLAIPVEVSGGRDRFSYKLNGSVGLQAFREDGAAFYPTSTVLQNALNDFAANNPNLDVETGYPSKSSSGLGYNFSGEMEYLLAPRLSVGALLALDNARDFNETLVFGYLKYWFNPQISTAESPRSISPHYSFGDPNR